MKRNGLGIEADMVAGLVDAQAKIKIFCIHKKAFVKKADLVEDGFFYHKKGARNSLNCVGFGEVLPALVVLAEELGLGKEFFEFGEVGETGPRRGEAAMAGRIESEVILIKVGWSGNGLEFFWSKWVFGGQEAAGTGGVLGIMMHKIELSLESGWREEYV